MSIPFLPSEIPSFRSEMSVYRCRVTGGYTAPRTGCVRSTTPRGIDDVTFACSCGLAGAVWFSDHDDEERETEGEVGCEEGGDVTAPRGTFCEVGGVTEDSRMAGKGPLCREEDEEEGVEEGNPMKAGNHVGRKGEAGRGGREGLEMAFPVFQGILNIE